MIFKYKLNNSKLFNIMLCKSGKYDKYDKYDYDYDVL